MDIKDCIIVDLETTEGDDHLVNEVGAVRYSVEHQCIIGCFSALVSTNADGIPSPPNTISGINPKAAEHYGIFGGGLVDSIHEALGVFKHDYPFFIAHNVEHEQKYINYPNWLCTYRDFNLYPENYIGRRDLFSLALANGVGISQGHRAIYDCLLIAEVFNRRPNLQADFEYAQRPFIELIAPKDDTTITKGWRWDYTKQGWFQKDDPFWNDPDCQISHLIWQESPRIKVKALGGYAIKDLAKSWGFQWIPEKKEWQRLVNVNAAAMDMFPFELEEVAE